MKIQANQAPQQMFDISIHPQQNGKAIVRMFENMVTVDDNLVEYDSYEIIVPLTNGLAFNIQENYPKWLATAKSCNAVDVALAQRDQEIAELDIAFLESTYTNALSEVG